MAGSNSISIASEIELVICKADDWKTKFSAFGYALNLSMITFVSTINVIAIDDRPCDLDGSMKSEISSRRMPQRIPKIPSIYIALQMVITRKRCRNERHSHWLEANEDHRARNNEFRSPCSKDYFSTRQRTLKVLRRMQRKIT